MPARRPNNPDHLRIFPAYAPKRGSRKLRCDRCNALPWCRQTVRHFAWMLCEAPDASQRVRWQRQGVDILQITTEIWAHAPEIWKGV